MASTENIDRTAARQRNLRKIGAEIAGRLEYLEAEARRVGLEPAAVDAFSEAAKAMAGRFPPVPFTPKQRSEAA